MFNNLANYLLGTSNQQPRQQEERDEGAEENSNLRLTSVVSDDDDWVLVDRDSEGNSELSSEESECETNLTDADRLDVRLSRTSSSSSLVPCAASASAMDESWFLTPPPCFISAGPVHMETSPLENLLIEHPSMSVYQQPVLAIRRHPALEAVADDDETNDHDGGDEDDFLEVQVQQPQQQQPRRNRVEVIRQQERQGVKSKQAQKVQIQKACQSLKRGYLERNNKAREVNCRNQRLRRGERSQGATRSHANNNRKC